MPNLHEKVTGPIERWLGHELRETSYGCLTRETDGTDLDDPAFYIGGEVYLRFDNGMSVAISWDENAGWKCHFSLVVAETSVFNPGALRVWSAGCFQSWTKVMGKPLLNARVYGYDETPHILGLSFDTNTSVFVGVGHEQEFGDGDDVLIRSSDNMIDLSDWDLFWSGSAA